MRPERAVADVAHGVDRLARAAGGDEHAQAVPAAARAAGRAASTAASSVGGLGAGGRRPTRPWSASAPTPGSSTVTPRSRSVATLACVAGVLPHVVVHRGRDEHRAGRGERRARQQVVGEAVRRAWRSCWRVAGAIRSTSALRTSSRWLSGSWSGGVWSGNAPRAGSRSNSVGEDRRAGQRRERRARRRSAGCRASG